MKRKVSLVVIPIDDFTDEVIIKEQVYIKINEINKDIIRKQEGFLIITDLQEDFIKLHISAYSFMSVNINVNLNELNRLEPIITIRLKPSDRYNFNFGTTCIQGKTKSDSEILIINNNKRNTFRLLEDINIEAKSIKIYNPLNIKLDGSKIIIKDNTEEYKCNEILEFDSKYKSYILKHNVLREYKKEISQIVKAEFVKTDKDGNFFVPLKGLTDEDNLIHIKTEDDVLHNIMLQKGKINNIELI